MSRCDTREPSWRIEPLQRAGWSLATLHYGDYDGLDALAKPWVVEHKTVGKLLEDMQSGVLTRQCRAMVDYCLRENGYPILMIEGHWMQNAGTLLNSSITWEQAWNQLQSLQDLGCRIQIATSPLHTVQRLLELEQYYAKEHHSSVERHPSGDPFIAALSLIHGIDEGKARAIKAEMPCLGQVAMRCHSDLEAIMAIKGIGVVLAQRIQEFFWSIPSAPPPGGPVTLPPLSSVPNSNSEDRIRGAGGVRGDNGAEGRRKNI